MVKFSETCSFLCRHWMSCLWKLKQLRRVTVWVLIRQGCQRSTDCQHHQCILRVLQIPTQLLLKIQSPESPRTQGSFSHRFILIQILMELDAFTRQVFIQRLICKTSECAYWSEFFFFFCDTSKALYSFDCPVQLWRWLEFDLPGLAHREVGIFF